MKAAPMFHAEPTALPLPSQRRLVTQAESEAYLQMVSRARRQLLDFAAVNPAVDPLVAADRVRCARCKTPFPDPPTHTGCCEKAGCGGTAERY